MSLYYKDADAALICFDLSNAKSFDSVRYWSAEMDKNCNKEAFTLAMAGNKCDIDDSEKKISLSMANELAKELGMIY